MLKKYLQALLEAFIGSKKEWVALQGKPFIEHSKGTFTSSGEQSVVAPVSGYAQIVSTSGWKCKSLSISANSAMLIPTAWEFGVATIPVKKGDTVRMSANSGDPSVTPTFQYTFFKDVGSP